MTVRMMLESTAGMISVQKRQTSAAESRVFSGVLWHKRNSCPSRSGCASVPASAMIRGYIGPAKEQQVPPRRRRFRSASGRNDKV
jgi:hypothetical protein